VNLAESERSDPAREEWALAYLLRVSRSALLRGAPMDEITELMDECDAAIAAGLSHTSSMEGLAR
jgi:hypothetical protein